MQTDRLGDAVLVLAKFCVVRFLAYFKTAFQPWCRMMWSFLNKIEMSRSTPEFSDLSKIEEELLVAKLHAARKAISHAGEKGRALESEVLNLIRSFLPIEYGLSNKDRL